MIPKGNKRSKSCLVLKLNQIQNWEGSQSLNSKLMLSNKAVTSHLWLFILKLIKIKFKIKLLSALPIFQVLKSHLRLVDTILVQQRLQNISTGQKVLQCWALLL